jgi:hypothetical protein
MNPHGLDAERTRSSGVSESAAAQTQIANGTFISQACLIGDETIVPFL